MSVILMPARMGHLGLDITLLSDENGRFHRSKRQSIARLALYAEYLAKLSFINGF